MIIEWKRASDGLPDSAKRILVTRDINGNRYVDVMTYVPEPGSGLPPMCSTVHVTHWSEMPEPASDES